MSKLTEVLKLLCYDPETDGNLTFNVTEALTKNWEKIDQMVLLAIAAAAAYDPEGSYAVGDYATHGGKLHKCNTPIPSGETWNPAHWTETTVAAELADIRESLSNKADASTITLDSWDALINAKSGWYLVSNLVSGMPTTGHWWHVTVLSEPSKQQKTFSAVDVSLENKEAPNAWNGSIVNGTFLGWIGPYSTATPPQEYDLPLTDGISTYGKSTYWKTQEGICFINFAVSSTQPITSEFVIATLPAGFRPSVKVFAGGHGYSNLDTNIRVGIDVEVNPNGSILIWTETPLNNAYGFIGFIADS